MKRFLAVCLLGFLAVQWVAFAQARALLTFQESGQRTARPESLDRVDRAVVLLTGVQIPKPTNRRDPSSEGLEFERVQFWSDSGETLEAWNIERGERPVTVLMFHGYGGSKDSLLGAAGSFAARGFDCLLVDFFGSGGSSGSRTTLGMEESHDVAAALAFAQTRKPHHRLILYGSSMGAAAILRAVAHLGIEPDGVILESVFSTLMETTARRFELMELPPRPLADFLLFWGGVQAGIDPYDHRPVDDALSLRAPTLVLHGALDTRATPAQGKRVFEALAGQKRFHLAPRGGHASLFHVDREAWSQEVNWLLDAASR